MLCSKTNSLLYIFQFLKMKGSKQGLMGIGVLTRTLKVNCDFTLIFSDFMILLLLFKNEGYVCLSF
jgi:hypothetical protein